MAMAKLKISPLSDNHWNVRSFTQVMTRKELQDTFDFHGDWVLRAGGRAFIKHKHLGVGRYKVWLETDSGRDWAKH
jgi:hypothetical protein